MPNVSDVTGLQRVLLMEQVGKGACDPVHGDVFGRRCVCGGVRGAQERFPEGDRTCSECTCKERWVQAQMNLLRSV